jgi:flagellar protein FliO/FliZ
MNPGVNLLGAVGWFVAIVVAIPVVLWLLRRSPLGARLGAAQPAGMRAVAQLALGAQNRLVTVEVGSGDERRWLVLGVAPGGVSLLHSLTPQDPPPAPPLAPTPGEGFQQLLQRLRRDDGTRGDGRAR